MASSSSARHTRNTPSVPTRITSARASISVTAAMVPPIMKGMRRPRGLRTLSDSAPKKGSKNSASTLSMAITTPAQVSPRP